MAGIDCSVTVNFLKEWRRYCGGRRCGYCNLSEHNECGFPACQVKDFPERAVDVIQKWSDENPVKTRLDDLLERCPNVPLDGEGFPCFSPSMLGYCGDCVGCRNWKNPDVRNCWNEPVDGDNVFDIHKDNVIFYDASHVIPDDVIPIIREIQTRLM